ncbi:peptide ABC transporter substrate-binding protein [Paenibacillus sp. FSL M7-0896]|uniref:peptide ABC transporter substrate-binding protein n=1 Tax=Paenibacillus sp. FSL M7-0896 TaxID=2921610 RepID=UPI0030DAF53A
MKRLFYVIFVIVLIGSVMLTEGMGTASALQADKVLRIGMKNLPSNLDPAVVSDAGSITTIKGLYEGLFRLNSSGIAVPAVAKSWSLSKDGRTYTFTLRADAKWSNGQQVTASDFEYAWKRALSPADDNDSIYSYTMFVINNAEQYYQGTLKNPSSVGIKALNSTTLQVTLKEKSSYFIQMLADCTYFPVYSKIAKSNSKWASNISTMVTNGPYKLKEWKSNGISLVKNPIYYAAKEIKFSEVQLLWQDNPTTAFINDEIDWAGNGGAYETLDYAALDNKPNLVIRKAADSTAYFYHFNVNKPPFNNLKIRKALSMAINREGLNFGHPAFGFVPLSIHGTKFNFRSEVSDRAYFEEDVAAAKELLKEGLREAGLIKLPTFSIIVNKSSLHEDIAANVIKDWRENLGIEASIEVQSFEELLDNRDDQNYAIARGSWTADYNDPYTMLNLFSSQSGSNYTGWSNTQYDRYLQQANQVTDPAKRIQFFASAEKILMDQMVMIPLFYAEIEYLSNPNVQNVYIDYDGSIAFTRGSWR